VTSDLPICDAAAPARRLRRLQCCCQSCRHGRRRLRCSFGSFSRRFIDAVRGRWQAADVAQILYYDHTIHPHPHQHPRPRSDHCTAAPEMAALLHAPPSKAPSGRRTAFAGATTSMNVSGRGMCRPIAIQQPQRQPPALRRGRMASGVHRGISQPSHACRYLDGAGAGWRTKKVMRRNQSWSCPSELTWPSLPAADPPPPQLNSSSSSIPSCPVLSCLVCLL
jgi:hypothetical protein